MNLARLIAFTALVATTRPAAAQSHHHDRPAPPNCECTACVAVPGTKKATSYEYQTKGVTKCYVKARFDLFRRLRHEPLPAPEAVPTRRRVLMKREVSREEPVVKYEARTVAAPCAAHHREHCHACGGG